MCEGSLEDDGSEDDHRRFVPVWTDCTGGKQELSVKEKDDIHEQCIHDIWVNSDIYVEVAMSINL